jgi:CheY-like chemotaxis protein
MKNVLLIEDDEVKRQSIQQALTSKFRVRVFFANSVRSAIIALEAEYDLLIADMSLPTYDIEARERGGTPRPFGGIEVFEHLERIESSVPVVVVTSYPAISDGKKSLTVSDLEVQLRTDFPLTFRGIVYFDFAYAEWEQKFIDLLGKLLKDNDD